jgi:hypothetical protein
MSPHLAQRVSSLQCSGKRPVSWVLLTIGSVQQIGGEEMRMLRALKREDGSSRYVFMTERGAPMTPAGFRKFLSRLAIGANLRGPPLLRDKVPSSERASCALRREHSDRWMSAEAPWRMRRPTRDRIWRERRHGSVTAPARRHSPREEARREVFHGEKETYIN